MTDLNKQELRRLAERASPAIEWYVPGDLRYADDKTGEVHGLDHDDDRFIAAANPATILSLLDELEKAQEIGRISCNFDGYKSVLDERDQLRAEVEALRELLDIYRPEWGGAPSERLSEIEALRKDAERFRWASGGMHEAETLMSIVACHGGYAEKIAERVDVYMEANMGKPCGGLGCCQLCADEKAGEVGNG